MTEFETFEEATNQFLSKDIPQKSTTCEYTYPKETLEVDGQEVTKIRKNKDNSVSFYNGRERIEKIEDGG